MATGWTMQVRPMVGLYDVESWRALAHLADERKPFTVRMGTIFESSHLPLHLWLQIIHLMCASKKGISTHQIQRMLRCSMKTAWFLGHRIRESMREVRDMFTPPMGGAGRTIEADPLAEASATARRRQRTMRSP